MKNRTICTTTAPRQGKSGQGGKRRSVGATRARPVVADAGHGRTASANRPTWSGQTGSWRTVERIQHGDAQAVGDLYDRYNAEVYKYLWLWSGSEPLAQELARRVWDRSLQAIGVLRATGESPLCWLLGIARDEAIEHFRSQRYRLGLIDVGAMQDVPIASGDGDMDAAALFAALRRLSPAQQEAIALTYFCGLDDSGAAAVMGRTPAMIQALTWRGRVRLAAMLTGGPGD
ncbi:MAG: hypothetical protein HOV79_13010 [Hamadaea sp.]|nr:hypothetical protein [Hamadaea sp.]